MVIITTIATKTPKKEPCINRSLRDEAPLLVVLFWLLLSWLSWLCFWDELGSFPVPPLLVGTVPAVVVVVVEEFEDVDLFLPMSG